MLNKSKLQAFQGLAPARLCKKRGGVASLENECIRGEHLLFYQWLWLDGFARAFDGEVSVGGRVGG